MEKWEELFPQNTRKKGRELLENGRIRELSVNENEYSAAVLGRERYEVKISMDHGIPVRTECSCAVGRGRGKCAHMAVCGGAGKGRRGKEKQGGAGGSGGILPSGWNGDRPGQRRGRKESNQNAPGLPILSWRPDP